MGGPLHLVQRGGAWAGLQYQLHIIIIKVPLQSKELTSMTTLSSLTHNRPLPFNKEDNDFLSNLYDDITCCHAHDRIQR